MEVGPEEEVAIRKKQTVHLQKLNEDLASIESYDRDAPKLELALKKRELLAFGNRDEKLNTFEEHPLNCPIDEFRKYGGGLPLYFIFLKVMIIVFLLISLVSCFTLTAYAVANGMKANEAKSFYDKLTAANLGLPNVTELSRNVTAGEETLQTRLDRAMYPDVAYTIIAFLGLIILRFLFWKERQTQTRTLLRVRDYSLEIRDLPADTTEQEIHDCLSQYGTIREVALARQFEGVMHLFESLAEQEVLLKDEEARLALSPERDPRKKEAIQNKLQAVRQEITAARMMRGRNLPKVSGFPVFSAYVIFESVQERDKALQTLQAIEFTESPLRFCCLCRRMPVVARDQLLRGVTKLKVKEPEQPDSILWENIGTKTEEKAKRLVLAYLASIALILVSLILNFFGTFLSDVDPDNCQRFQNLSDSQLSRIDVQQLQGDDQDCFCQSVSTSLKESNAMIAGYCNDYSTKTTWLYILNIIMGCIISIFNSLLNLLIMKLADYRRFSTRTEYFITTIRNSATAQFINTALTPLICYANIYGFVLPIAFFNVVIPPLGTSLSASRSKFSTDFNRHWYINVGAKITTSMIYNIVSPHLLLLLLIPLRRWFFEKKLATGAIIQKDLNNYYSYPKYTFRYAQVLTTIFVCMFYSSGMPLLLIIGTLALFIIYWSEKTTLVKDSSQPGFFEVDVARSIANYLPLCLAFHAALSVGMYGADAVFPTEVSVLSGLTSNSTVTGNQTTTQIPSTTGAAARIKKTPALFSFVLVCLILVFLDRLVWEAIKKIAAFLLHLQSIGTESKQREREFGTFSQEQERLSYGGLMTYDTRKMQRYKPILEAIDNYNEQNNPHEEKESILVKE